MTGDDLQAMVQKAGSEYAEILAAVEDVHRAMFNVEPPSRFAAVFVQALAQRGYMIEQEVS